jgi:hypothetical protein
MTRAAINIKKLALYLAIFLAGCTTVTTYYEKITKETLITEAEYLASLPDDIYPESRGRLPIVDRAALDEEGQAVYDRYTSPASTSLAGLPGPGGLRLHARVDKTPTRIDDRVRALIRLSMARELDMVFEWTLYEPVGLKAGLTTDVMDAIRYNKSLASVPPFESSIIQLARDVLSNHHVSSETYQLLQEQFGNKDLMEIAYLMGDAMESYVLLFMFDVHLPYDRKPLLPVD